MPERCHARAAGTRRHGSCHAKGGKHRAGRHACFVPESVEGRFRTHHHYVEGFCWLADRRATISGGVALAAVASKAQAAGLRDKPPPEIDRSQVHKSLRNAWSTEVLLALPGEWAKDEDEFLRLSNTWGVVQAYYTGYHVTQALIVAKGNLRPTTHPQTQQQYAALWVDRPLDCPPWTFGVSHRGWHNAPRGADIDLSLHPWTTCSSTSCWSLAGRALKSTRDDAVRKQVDAERDKALKRRKKEWEAEEADRLAAGRSPRRSPTFGRPRLTDVQKTACDSRVRTYTLLDYLYRLRIGANYDDASVFTDGPDNDADSYLLHRRIAFLASGLALMGELRIRELVGADHFDRWAEQFAAANIPPGYTLGIKQRLHLLSSASLA